MITNLDRLRIYPVELDTNFTVQNNDYTTSKEANSNIKTNSEKVPKHPSIKIIGNDFSDNFTANYPFFYAVGPESQIFTIDKVNNLSKSVENFVLEIGGKSLGNKVSLNYVIWEMADEHLLGIVFEKKTLVGQDSLSALVSMQYDSKTGNYFELTDIFKPGIEQKLSEIVKDPKYILYRKLDNPINGSAIPKTESFSRGTSPQIENFTNFLLGETTITFYFSPGQSAEFSEGITFMVIEYNDLKDWFKDNFKELYEEQYTYSAF